MLPIHETHFWAVAQEPNNGNFAYANSLHILARGFDMVIRTSATSASMPSWGGEELSLDGWGLNLSGLMV
jgi:hypothetical protein